jgi:basic amino acid/polyamine antiporter, APA family
MLERKISGWQATLLVVGAMVGSGILATPAIVAASSSSTNMVMLFWLGGGFYAMMGALSQAELAARYPEAGGDYVFLREAFGKLTAFLSGWVSLTVGFAGAIAGLALTCAHYLGRTGLPLEGLDTLVATVIIVALTAVNLLGVEKGSATQAVLTVGKVVGLLLLAVVAWYGAGAAKPMAPPVAPIWAALLPVIFTYSGWNDSIYLGSEIIRPRRNLPLSLIAGTAGVTLLYLLFNFAYLKVTAGTSVDGDLAAASSMAQQALGGQATLAVSILAALMLLGTIAALVVSGPRIAWAMAQDRALPQWFGKVSKRGVPAPSLYLQAAIALFFVQVGTVGQIFSWVGFAIVVFSGLATACVFVERARGHKPKGYRIPLYPLPPLIYVAGSIAIAVTVLISNPRDTAWGVGFIVAGLPIYWLSKYRHRRRV